MGVRYRGEPEFVIEGNPSGIRGRVASMKTCSESFDRVGESLGGVETEHWVGKAADRFRSRLGEEPRRWTGVADGFRSAAAALEGYAAALEAAQQAAQVCKENYEEGKRVSATAKADYDRDVSEGFQKKAAWEAQNGPGSYTLTITPFTDPGQALRDRAVADFQAVIEDLEKTGSDTEQAVAQAHADADPTRQWPNKGTLNLGAAGALSNSDRKGDRAREEDRRNPDGRRGLRIERDERRRIEKGELSELIPGIDHFNNDWAGRAILERYLTGGSDWNIDNDPAWTRYMQENQSLTNQMKERNDTQASAAVLRYKENHGKTIYRSFLGENLKMEIENGEGIVGYQYLHGVDQTVGGFKHGGTTSVKPLPDGNYEVTIDSTYQWNDIIDPNGKYPSDVAKSTAAEIMTFGQADPYDIHIGWEGSSKVIVDGEGNVVSGEGWPY